MRYRSVAQLNTDCLAFAQQLPKEITSVMGVPRSGLLPAVLLAKYLNLPMGISERTLLVEDSILKGRAMKRVKRAVQPYKTAAMYVKPGKQGLVDYHHLVLPTPRFFEWNIWHHPKLAKMCMDIDGVLCRDPVTKENDNGPRYEHFITTVAPRIVPQKTIGWLVTCRLERWRPHTEAWLAKHGIPYKHLVMCPGIDRRRGHEHGRHKVRIYDWTKAILFIESSLRQAQVMAALTDKPILCIETGRIICKS